MCEFCKNYNFARAKAEVIENDANIYLSLCNSKFPKEQQFKYCPVCGDDLNKTKTQYDRIRNMSVEEMAEFMGDVYKQGYIDDLHDMPCVENKEIKKWIESEVDTE